MNAVASNLVEKTPKVSVGIPVYNGANYLVPLIDSLLAQTFTDFEIVIGDNASTDQTPEIARGYVARDPRVRYFRNPENVGPVENFNLVYRACRAPYMKWTCHDDMYAPTFLQRCVEELDARSDVVAVGTDCYFIDATGEKYEFDRATGLQHDPETGAVFEADSLDLGSSASALVRFNDVLWNCTSAHTVFGVARREVLDKTLLFRQLYESDKRLVLDLAMHGKLYHVRERLYLKRLHPEMSGAKNRDEQKRFMGPRAAIKSLRLRKLREFFATPLLSPKGLAFKVAATVLVAAYTVSFAPVVAMRVLGVKRGRDTDLRAAAVASTDETGVVAKPAMKQTH